METRKNLTIFALVTADTVTGVVLGNRFLSAVDINKLRDLKAENRNKSNTPRSVIDKLLASTTAQINQTIAQLGTAAIIYLLANR